MMQCDACGSTMKPLFTSFYCPRCAGDDSAADDVGYVYVTHPRNRSSICEGGCGVATLKDRLNSTWGAYWYENSKPAYDEARQNSGMMIFKLKRSWEGFRDPPDTARFKSGIVQLLKGVTFPIGSLVHGSMK